MTENLTPSTSIPYLRLSEMNALVQAVLQSEFCDRYWVVAELSEVRRRPGSHCYIELIEKEANGNRLLAKTSAVIWNGVYDEVVPEFERITGVSFASGIKVLLQVSLSFHEVYGLKLVVEDIDPSFTLGEQQRRRQQILEQLKADGVLTLNQELDFPQLPLRVAVVSSASAAGYGDFMKQIETSPFAFHTQLFPAVMQGDRVEGSVIAALEEIAEQESEWDLVVIIRGGGAVSDLNGFESYLLAAHVAQFPLPVLTGIGHERDETVIDLVAHRRLKTPTAVAAFLIEILQGEAETLTTFSQYIKSGAEALLLREEELLKRAEMNLGTCAQHAVQNAEQRLQLLIQNIGGAALAYLGQWNERIRFWNLQIEQGAQQALHASAQK
ncbi:MAG: exodeoxyribonuclease VII large subunit, partial [Bacteroidaceae bacterium]|nr:exodeoxyribonuclease VII large subunit [Bacteroidaceae bacterium]